MACYYIEGGNGGRLTMVVDDTGTVLFNKPTVSGAAVKNVAGWSTKSKPVSDRFTNVTESDGKHSTR